jgi:hypothetical protein
MGESYDQKDAAGFIRILGLPSRSRAMKNKQPLTAESAEEEQNSPKTREVVR